MGAAVGFLSGMFGVGGGFLITPLLIFYNIPPVVAVATGANQVVASSISGAITHFRRGTIDIKLGCVLLCGRPHRRLIGVWIFSFLRRIGQLDLVISLLYVVLLGVVGALMLAESLRAMRKVSRNQSVTLKRPGQHNWVHRLPFKVRFKKSKIYLSIIPFVALGMGIGVLTSVMGVGGGFIMVPAMIYLLRIPTNVVVGTSLFQIIFVSSYAVIVQASANYSVDIVLAFILMVAGVIGAHMACGSARNCAANSCARSWPSWCWPSASALPSTSSFPRPISIRSSPRGSAIDARPSPRAPFPLCRPGARACRRPAGRGPDGWQRRGAAVG